MTRSIGGNYWQDFSTNAWTLENGVYKMEISNDLHGLGHACHLEVTRLENSVYKSVAVHYDIDANGNITVYSGEAFTGIYYVVSGV